MNRTWISVVVFGLCVMVSGLVRADGPTDNQAEKVRPVPPLGIEVPEDQRDDLEDGLKKLKTIIDELALSKDARVKELLPDVQIYHKAVFDALTYREFFKPQEINTAKSLLVDGQTRAEHLKAGNAPWTTQAGLVPRGYVSKIDGSVQPYGLIIPDSFTPTGPHRWRMDLWFHGRGEVLSELNFLEDRRKNKGQFTPADTIVLHPYGRYCNANKLAGEIDSLEAIESVKRRYRIDDDRIAVRGFSMGGAACWQFAVHYADRWAAAAPGAGFSETPDFLKVFQKETLEPTWFEKKLWHMYDCTDWAANLAQLPTVAYSGDKDSQKQAADIMAVALKKEGIELTHLIGPDTAHSYHPVTKLEVDRRIDSIMALGRERMPRTIRFVTYSLRYNRMHWVTVDAIKEHWSQARVNAAIVADSFVSVTTNNIEQLTLSIPSGYAPMAVDASVQIKIDDQTIDGPHPGSDLSWQVTLHREGAAWKLGALPANGLRKRHGLQGPIDDALMDSFVFVRPTAKSSHEAVEKWVQAEMSHAIVHWRQQFRGHARVVDDTAVTDEHIANSNLILWGDPTSNAVLKKIADKLPIRWGDSEITVGDEKFPSDRHAAIAIYPNPLNSNRYVVLNSSFTFREYDYLNNARQVPKLPDWAIIDLRTPPGSRSPGKIAEAGFFNEQWQLKAGQE
ncbi:MAG: prolyl oligopeptidase family serine peptidase [Planctomycetia bacterium]|nr:prolyl oligopeptidase family serine peptidase [Planctomycetia bacterium]